MKKTPTSKYWVYDQFKLVEMELELRSNDIEGVWFDDIYSRGYDPFYVDKDKEKLRRRVEDSLKREVAELTEEVDMLLAKINGLYGR